MRTRNSVPDDLRRKRWDAKTGRRMLAALRLSGMSQSAFARAHGMNVQRLIWWRKRLGMGGDGRRVGSAPLMFVPAAVSGAAARVAVRLPGGIELEAADVAALPAAWVAALVRELAGPT